jgi:hypothetical protein
MFKTLYVAIKFFSMHCLWIFTTWKKYLCYLCFLGLYYFVKDDEVQRFDWLVDNIYNDNYAMVSNLNSCDFLRSLFWFHRLIIGDVSNWTCTYVSLINDFSSLLWTIQIHGQTFIINASIKFILRWNTVKYNLDRERASKVHVCKKDIS